MKNPSIRAFYAQDQHHKHSYFFSQRKRSLKMSTSYSHIIHRFIHIFHTYISLLHHINNFSVFSKIYHVDCKIILLIEIKLRFLTKK